MSDFRLTRRQFVQRGLACGAAAIVAPQLISCAAQSDPTPPPASGTLSPVDCMPMLYWTGEREASLAWPVKNLSRGWVEYGNTPALGKKALAGDDVEDFLEGFSDTVIETVVKRHLNNPKYADANVLRARMNDLAPGSRVYYRIHTDPVDSANPSLYGPVRQFTLPDSRAKQIRISVWNDTHDNLATLQGLYQLTNAEPSDLLIWNGDISNNVERENQMVPLYLAPGKGLDISADRPVVMTRGNHDVRGALAALLGHYSAQRKSYFSFRLGPVAGIVLDTGEDKPDNHPTFLGRPAFEPFLKKQAQWLAQEIERPGIADAPYRLVFCHIPLRWRDEKPQDYDRSGYDRFCVRGRQVWHDSLVKWKTQLVVSGHTHETHFMPPTAEFPYAQLTGGGPLPNAATLVRLLADSKSLSVRVLKLSGDVIREETLSPIPGAK
jgi:predicted phosphodiesterase